MRPEVRVERDDMLAALLAARPPRQVPLALAKAAKRRAGSRAIVIFGMAFGLFGMVFVVIFFPWKFIEDWRLRRESAAVTTGRIVTAEATRTSINETPVWLYRHEFVLSDQPISGACYTTGRRFGVGDSVTIRYLPSDPRISCVEGARSSMGDGTGLFVLIFPAIGFGMAAWTLVRSRRAMALLRNGKLGEAIVAAVEKTGTQINYQPVFKVTLRLRDAGTAVPVVIRCHAPDTVTFAETPAPKRPAGVCAVRSAAAETAAIAGGAVKRGRRRGDGTDGRQSAGNASGGGSGPPTLNLFRVDRSCYF